MKKLIFILLISLVASIALNLKFCAKITASEAKNKQEETKTAKKYANKNRNIPRHNMEYLENRTKEETKRDMESGKPEFDCIGSLDVRQCTDYEWDIIVEKKAEKMKQLCETEGKKEACEYNMEKDKERLKKRRQGLVERLQKRQEERN